MSNDIELPIHHEVLDALRSWRQSQARERGVPAYWILTNRTMAQVATSLPSTVEELGKVEGMGDARLDRYGEAILESVRVSRPKVKALSGYTVQGRALSI